MIDIKDLREHTELYKKNNIKKDRDPKIVDHVLELDEEWRAVKLKTDNLRHERNEVSEAINLAKKAHNGSKMKDLIKRAREIPSKLKNLELEEKDLWNSLEQNLRQIPNIMAPEVPKGKSDKDNKVVKTHGRIKKPTFKLKTHVEVAEDLDVADFDASAKVSGNGFYYLKKDLALLNRALINFAIDFMLKKGHEYIEPPLMINRDVAAAAGDLNAFKDAIYKVEDEDLYLVPTAEHPLLGMMSGKTISEEKLPIKLFGYSMCFRREIGSHGINEKGLWRTHQFNKIEQFVFCSPKDSWKIYSELLKNTEEIMQKLGLPYRILEICTADLGDWKSRSQDIEVWRPTINKYAEVASLSNCTDFQARDLDIKGINRAGERYVLHTLNNTALATSRIMVAILENYQNKDGSVTIPKILIPYMHGKKKITNEYSTIKRKNGKKKKPKISRKNK